ncbi:MAG: hypothetical protein ABI898_06960 [Sphingomonadales bacterium]
MKRFIVASTIIAMGVATASAAPRDRQTPPPATPDGKPVSCVQTTNIRNTSVHGDGVIDFHMNNGKVYRNTLPMSCPSLGFEERFMYKTSISQLCSVDTITVLQSPGLSQGATCGLGQFQPVKIVKVSKPAG